MKGIKILWVLVVYKVELESSEAFISLRKASAKFGKKVFLLIYDNSPNPHKFYNDCEYLEIIYIHDNTNPGVSKAYIEGGKIAERLDCDWMLLTDQDTIFPEETFLAFEKALIEFPKIKLITPILLQGKTIVSPSLYFLKRGWTVSKITPGIAHLKNMSPINSGMFINVEEYNKTKHKEEVKLDFSDFVFIERFKIRNHQFVILDLYCQHNISGSDYSSITSAKKRFEYYCEGAKNFGEKTKDKIILIFIVFLRSLKLSITFKNLVFFKTFLAFLRKKGQ